MVKIGRFPYDKERAPSVGGSEKPITFEEWWESHSSLTNPKDKSLSAWNAGCKFERERIADWLEKLAMGLKNLDSSRAIIMASQMIRDFIFK